MRYVVTSNRHDKAGVRLFFVEAERPYWFSHREKATLFTEVADAIAAVMCEQDRLNDAALWGTEVVEVPDDTT